MQFNFDNDARFDVALDNDKSSKLCNFVTKKQKQIFVAKKDEQFHSTVMITGLNVTRKLGGTERGFKRKSM